MKRPSFTPADIGVTNPDETGAVILHLRDAKGNDQLVPLSAIIRANLGQRLISGPIAAPGTPGPALYLKPTNTRIYENMNGELVLELQLGGGRAVHVLLHGLLPEALTLQLQELAPGAQERPLQ